MSLRGKHNALSSTVVTKLSILHCALNTGNLESIFLFFLFLFVLASWVSTGNKTSWYGNMCGIQNAESYNCISDIRNMYAESTGGLRRGHSPLTPGCGSNHRQRINEYGHIPIKFYLLMDTGSLISYNFHVSKNALFPLIFFFFFFTIRKMLKPFSSGGLNLAGGPNLWPFF